MNKIKDYIKLIGILGLAFLLSSLMRGTVFLMDSPQLRPNLMAYLFDKTQTTLAQLIHIPPSQLMKDVKPELLMKGVYAKSAPNMTSTEYKMNEIEWVEYTFTLKNNRIIKVQVPKGQAPPSSKVLEYSQ